MSANKPKPTNPHADAIRRRIGDCIESLNRIRRDTAEQTVNAELLADLAEDVAIITYECGRFNEWKP